jgi:TPR repeat protein
MVGKRLALLIANAEYQHDELRKLNARKEDLRALQTLLSRQDIGGYQTQVLVEGTKGAIERAIDRMLAKGEREDTVLIFFAGHGLKHENGKLYFAAIDTEPEYLGGTAVSSGWLMEQMQNSRVGRQIVMLDCCFGGAFARGNVWRGGDRIESGKALEVPDLQLEGRGQVVITSADAMQFALEGGALNGHPPASHFVRALTEGLETGEADRSPQDGLITIEELVNYLVGKLKILGSPQRPSKWTFGSIGGDLPFAYNPRAKAAVGSGYPSTLPVDWLEQGARYFKAGDYAKALALYQKAADVGSRDAMNNLGVLYRDALGVAQNYAKARGYFEKAADAGNRDAMSNLGWMFWDGLSATQDTFWKRIFKPRVRDYGKAREWFEKAAEEGQRDAMENLASMYQSGEGVAQDYAKACEWYQKAADAGGPEAMHNLGLLYESGKGVAQDYDKARRWYEKAAGAGQKDAMMALAKLYVEGRGVAEDFTKALEWLQKAAGAGQTDAMFFLGVLYDNGQKGVIAQDYAKAREWYQKATDAGHTKAKQALSRFHAK